MLVLTSLRRSDIDDHRPSGCGAQIGHPVLALHREAVVGVWLQVRHQHGGRRQAELPGDEMDAAAARRALPAVAGALPAVQAVGDVPAAARVSGGRPLQGDAGLVHRGDGVLWSGGRAWKWRKDGSRGVFIFIFIVVIRPSRK